MRFVVVGAGAIGGVVGARLVQSGHDVVVVARGAHGAAITADGLTIEDPDAAATLRVPVVTDAADVDYHHGDVTLLAVKSQDTAAAMTSIRAGGGDRHPIVCLQNGVANEPAVLRYAPVVLGVAVMCPALHVTPGVVQASSAPVTGCLDISPYPSSAGDDHHAGAAVAHNVAAAFRASTFLSDVVDDVMVAKHSKLLMNLANAVEVVCGPGNGPDLVARAHAEGVDVFTRAGVVFDTTPDPRREHITLRRIGGERRPGGSSWQSVLRGGTLETDFLSGEVVRIARSIGADAPVNATLQSLAARIAAGDAAPASFSEASVLALSAE